MTLGCCHPHQNRMLHIRFSLLHYGGAVDHLLGCQNLLFPPGHPRLCSLRFIQKTGMFFISECLYSLPSSLTLVINYSVMVNYVHIKPFSLRPDLRDLT